MPEMPLKVHFTQGDGKGWALDEDLRQIKESLAGMIRETGASRAEVFHAPFWQNLKMVSPELLGRAFVIAHADNPPFFYLKQPEFLAGQKQVDLWVARSREALEQFRHLGLSAIHIPYTIDPGLFFPIADKAAIRREFGIPENAYVIANFHRDTEGADLRTPKVQKNPEFMMAILRRLKGEGMAFHVLLAGPRRHWIREELRRAKIPFTFVGKEVEGDDFGTNILDRSTLNRLYNAADLYLIPSRWEGGPQSAMEAAACRCKILSVPIGVGRDILEPESLFSTGSEALRRLGDDIRHGGLDPTVQPQFDRWEASHTTATLKHSLQELYRGMPGMKSFRTKLAKRRPLLPQVILTQGAFTIRRRIFRPRLPVDVSWNHRTGVDASLDRIMERVARTLRDLGVAIRKEKGLKVEIVGWPQWRDGKASRFQWIVPEMYPDALLPDTVLIGLAVQDIINLHSAGCNQPSVVIPFLDASGEQSDEPFIVPEGDMKASCKVWKALEDGRPVIYPEESAYYEQVFHAGLPYEKGTDPSLLVEQGIEAAAELRELRHIPSSRATQMLLRALLLLDEAENNSMGMTSLIPWQIREGIRSLVKLPERRKVLKRQGLIRRRNKPDSPSVGFGGVLDDGRPVHGGAVKLLPLRAAFGGDEQSFDILYAVSSSQPECALNLFRRCREQGIRIVWNQNGVAYPAWADGESERFNAPMRRLRAMADHVVYQSHFCQMSAERYLGPSQVPSEILYNPVDLVRFVPVAKDRGNGPLRILAAGTHGTRDRVISVLEMLSQLREQGIESVLTVAGKFQWKNGEADFSRTIDRLGLSNFVRRVARFSQKDAPALYQAHDLLVHPKYMDPCPTVVIEAMACGLPVMGSASGGMPELVTRDCGTLVAAPLDWDHCHTPDGRQLASAVAGILPNLPTMGLSARKYAETRFAVDRWVEDHRRIFQTLPG